MERKTEQRIEEYTSLWIERCYKDGIPDFAPNELHDKVPSWKRIAVCLLKNDLRLTGLGFKGFESVFYSELKRIELKDRDKQLRLF